MKKEDKVKVVAQLGEVLKEYPHFYLVDVTAMNSASTNAMRAKCFKAGVKMLVVKNKLRNCIVLVCLLYNIVELIKRHKRIVIRAEDTAEAAADLFLIVFAKTVKISYIYCSSF